MIAFSRVRELGEEEDLGGMEFRKKKKEKKEGKGSKDREIKEKVNSGEIPKNSGNCDEREQNPSK